MALNKLDCNFESMQQIQRILFSELIKNETNGNGIHKNAFSSTSVDWERMGIFVIAKLYPCSLFLFVKKKQNKTNPNQNKTETKSKSSRK